MARYLCGVKVRNLRNKSNAGKSYMTMVIQTQPIVLVKGTGNPAAMHIHALPPATCATLETWGPGACGHRLFQAAGCAVTGETSLSA